MTTPSDLVAIATALYMMVKTAAAVIAITARGKRGDRALKVLRALMQDRARGR